MALKPKTAVFQVRVDPELLIRFQLMCEERQYTLSDFIRRVMITEVARFEEQREAMRRKRESLDQR